MDHCQISVSGYSILIIFILVIILDTDYAILEPVMDLSQNEEEDDTYGQLLKSKIFYQFNYLYYLCVVGPIRERRFSDPEIILLSPHSPSPSSLSNVIFFDSSPTGSANERESPKSRCELTFITVY